MGCASSSHDQSQEDQQQNKHKSAQETTFTDIKQQSTAASASSSSSQGDATRSSKYTTRGGSSGGNGRAGASSSSPSNLLEQLHSDIVFSLTPGSAEDVGSFFSGGEDSVINQFNIHSRLRHQSKAHQRTVTDLKWHTARRELFSASRDKTIKQWKMAPPEGNTLSLLQTFNGHSLPISSIDVVQQSSGDPIALVSGARDYQLRFWDIERGECSYWTEVQQNIITQVKWLQSEPLVLQASEDLSLRVWDARTREAVQTFSVCLGKRDKVAEKMWIFSYSHWLFLLFRSLLFFLLLGWAIFCSSL